MSRSKAFDNTLFSPQPYGWPKLLSERGRLEERWVMINQFVDWVSCLDPYLFDDVDKPFSMPVEDFMIRWGLAGSQVVSIPMVDSLANLF